MTREMGQKLGCNVMLGGERTIFSNDSAVPVGLGGRRLDPYTILVVHGQYTLDEALALIHAIEVPMPTGAYDYGGADVPDGGV